MKFELIEGCTDETLLVDGQPIISGVSKDTLIVYLNLVLSDLQPNDLMVILKELIMDYSTDIESLGHCETCGDSPYKYSLELL